MIKDIGAFYLTEKFASLVSTDLISSPSPFTTEVLTFQSPPPPLVRLYGKINLEEKAVTEKKSFCGEESILAVLSSHCKQWKNRFVLWYLVTVVKKTNLPKTKGLLSEWQMGKVWLLEKTHRIQHVSAY